MLSPLFSPSWYRVAGLKPRLRSHAQIHRHTYRGQVWYVLQDHSTGTFHRFTPSAYQLIALMDGGHTVNEMWELASARLGDDAPTQPEIISLLGRLHAADVLQTEIAPDSVEIFQRHQVRRRAAWKQRLTSPLAMRFSLFDPERLLTYCLPLVRPLFGWIGATIWLVIVGAALVLTVTHWASLTQDVVDQAFSPQNLLLLWFIYPIVKTLHEFGHAFATRVWGGEVHDMGIMLLVFMPMPYVDASAASAFRDTRKRAMVGAAGIVVDLFLAALALFVWLNAEPGIVRALAYNVILIGGVSTLLFNGNPLLRYDGYYILADLIEIPNLSQRATQYLGYIAKRILLGTQDEESPATAPGERGWFIAFGVASLAYRCFIIIAIMLFVAEKFFALGVLLASWATLTLLIVPALQAISALATNPALDASRGRTLAIAGAVMAAVVLVVFVIPAPLWSCAEGVVWLPEQSFVRAGTDGFVRRVIATPGTRVRQGDLLIECEDPILPARAHVSELELQGLKARYVALQYTNLVQAEIAKKEMAAVEADLARASERADALLMRSPADGVFLVPKVEDLPGRALRQGEVAGYVVEPSAITARVIVSQADIGLVRQRTERVAVRLAERLADAVPAVIEREVPAASDQLPSAALGTAAGGQVMVDPRDEHRLKTIEKTFQFDLRFLESVPSAHYGGRVYVRFDHGREVLALRWYRRMRQLFLRRLNV